MYVRIVIFVHEKFRTLFMRLTVCNTFSLVANRVQFYYFIVFIFNFSLHVFADLRTRLAFYILGFGNLSVAI